MRAFAAALLLLAAAVTRTAAAGLRSSSVKKDAFLAVPPGPAPPGTAAPGFAAAAAVKKAPLGEVWLELDNYLNVQYYGPFTVGGQSLPVIYDTGSFAIMMLSTHCRDRCGVRTPLYDQSRSPTYVDEVPAKLARHIYGGGMTLALRGQETVEIGPRKASKVPFWQVVAHNAPVWNLNSRFSGLVGLSHLELAPEMGGNTSKPCYENDAVLLERLGVPSFTMCYERGPGTPPGWLEMGAASENAARTSLYRNIPVVGDVHWAAQMTQFRFGGSGDLCNPSCAAIIDSGTSSITAPRYAIEAMMPVLQHIRRDCANLADLPDITLLLGGQWFTLPPAVYVVQMTYYRRRQPDWRTDHVGEDLYDLVQECVPVFRPMDMDSANGPIWILGVPFLRYHSVVFRRRPKSFLIALSDPQCRPTHSWGARPLNATDVPSLVSNATDKLVPLNTTDASAGWSLASLERMAEENPALRLPLWAVDKSRVDI